MISLYKPLGDLDRSDFIITPTPRGGKALSCVIADPRQCDFVPYIVLNGGLMGTVYQSPPSMPVRKIELHSHRIPPVPLMLFNYGDLGVPRKTALENGYNQDRHKNFYERQLSFFGLQLNLF